MKKWIGMGLVLALLVTAAPLWKATTAYAMTPFSMASYALNAYAAMEEEAAYWDEYVFELSPEQEKALEKMYRIIPELRELTNIDGYNDPDNNSWGVWLWTEQPEGETSSFTASASMDFNATTGELTSYNFNNPNWATNEGPSEQLAIRQAEAFIKGIMGNRTALYPLGIGGGGYSSWIDEDGNEISWHSTTVMFCPLINGIPFQDYYLHVDVDAFGNIVSFYQYSDYDLDPSLFVHPNQAVLSPTDAKRVMEREMTMEMAYLLEIPYYGQELPWLIYMGSGWWAIDAITGKNPYGYYDVKLEQQSFSISGQGKKMIAKTQQEVESFLTGFLGADLQGMVMDDEFRYDDYVTYSWYSDIDWEQPDADTSWRNYSVTTDAKSGEIIDFHSYSDEDGSKPAVVTEEEAKSIAMKFLQTVLPQENTELLLLTSTESLDNAPDWADPDLVDPMHFSQSEAWFSFISAHNGIPIYGGSYYYVSVNLSTGKLSGYGGSNATMPTNWPEATLAVSPDKAKNELIKNTKLQLIYIWPEWYGQKAPAPSLVYTTALDSDWLFIDALTGKAVNYAELMND